MTHDDRSGASPEHTAAADAQCTAAASASAESAADGVAANGSHQEARIRDESAAPRAQVHAASATAEQAAAGDAAKGAPQDEHVPVEAAACRAHSESAPPVTAFALANGAADFIAMPHVRAQDAAAAAQAEIAADVSAGVIQAGAEVRVPHSDAGVLDAPPPPCAQHPQSPLHAHGAAGEVIGPPVGANADIHLCRYTQITQRQPARGEWSARFKAQQLERLKLFYANPATPRGNLDLTAFSANA
jgi:hypothetical protein